MTSTNIKSNFNDNHNFNLNFNNNLQHHIKKYKISNELKRVLVFISTLLHHGDKPFEVKRLGFFVLFFFLIFFCI
jgi:hypothetical protein